jgi:hypothetical protein
METLKQLKLNAWEEIINEGIIGNKVKNNFKNFKELNQFIIENFNTELKCNFKDTYTGEIIQYNFCDLQKGFNRLKNRNWLNENVILEIFIDDFFKQLDEFYNLKF